jgi:hypothetical protein
MKAREEEITNATIRRTIESMTRDPQSDSSVIGVIGAGPCIGCDKTVYIDQRLIFHLPQHKRLCPSCYKMLCVVSG